MSKPSSLTDAYNTISTGIANPATAELRIAQEEVVRLQEINRVLDSKLQVRTLALRQLLGLMENEVRHRINVSAEIKNIRRVLEDG